MTGRVYKLKNWQVSTLVTLNAITLHFMTHNILVKQFSYKSLKKINLLNHSGLCLGSTFSGPFVKIKNIISFVKKKILTWDLVWDVFGLISWNEHKKYIVFGIPPEFRYFSILGKSEGLNLKQIVELGKIYEKSELVLCRSFLCVNVG